LLCLAGLYCMPLAIFKPKPSRFIVKPTDRGGKPSRMSSHVLLCLSWLATPQPWWPNLGVAVLWAFRSIASA